jgi:hypothetical protein
MSSAENKLLIQRYVDEIQSFMRMLLFCAPIVFFTPHSDGQEIEKPEYVLEAGAGWKLDFRDVHKNSLSVPESTFEDVKLIIATGATLEGGDGWRIKHNLGIGCEKQLLSGLSVIGFLDYARFDYHALQTLHPPYRTDPSHTLSIATLLKAHVPWYVSPFVQVGLGISYVNEGTLYYHAQYRYPPTPETDYVGGGRSGLTHLVNFMLGVELCPFKEFSLFLEGGVNGNWHKDLYPWNSLVRFGIGVGI